MPDQKATEQFYPTPNDIVRALLNARTPLHVLEPSQAAKFLKD